MYNIKSRVTTQLYNSHPQSPILPLDLWDWIGIKWVSKSAVIARLLYVGFVPLAIVWCSLVEIWPAERCKMGEVERGGFWVGRPVGDILSGNMILTADCWLLAEVFLLVISPKWGAGSLCQSWLFAVSTIAIIPVPRLAGPGWSQAKSDQPTSHDLPGKKVSTCSKPP